MSIEADDLLAERLNHEPVVLLGYTDSEFARGGQGRLSPCLSHHACYRLYGWQTPARPGRWLFTGLGLGGRSAAS